MGVEEDKPLILVADDDANCRNTTVAFLSGAGYQCDRAATGDEAVSLLKQTRYDLLLSDIEMPGNSNLHLIEMLPEIQPGLPVILLTGFPTIQTAAHSVTLSVFAYLIKPVEPEELLAKVSRAVELARCYRKVAGTRERLLAACKDLDHIESSLRLSASNDARSSMLAYLDLTMQNVASSLLEMRQLFEAMAAGSGKTPEMEWMQSARPLVLINALRETIAVLAATKGAFKSKELAELRRKLETLLHEQPPGPHAL